MLALEKISDQELHHRAIELAARDRRITVEVLAHLREIDRRQLYLQRGFSSLFAYVTQVLHYSDSAASRRIESMRLLRDAPLAEAALMSGQLSVSTLSQVGVFFRKCAQSPEGRKFSREEKQEVVREIEGMSKRKVDQYLAELSPVAKLPSEHVRSLTGEQVELRLVLDRATLDTLDQLKGLLAHQLKDFGASYSVLVAKLAELTFKRVDPTRTVRGEKTAAHKASAEPAGARGAAAGISGGNAPRTAARTGAAMTGAAAAGVKVACAPRAKASTSVVAESQTEMRFDGKTAGEESQTQTQTQSDSTPELTSPAKSDGPLLTLDASSLSFTPLSPRALRRTRAIPAHIRREVWRRDLEGGCAYVDPQTGRRCGGRHALELDHVVPFALGGETTSHNLRLACRRHNAYLGERCFGRVRRS